MEGMTARAEIAGHMTSGVRKKKVDEKQSSYAHRASLPLPRLLLPKGIHPS